MRLVELEPNEELERDGYRIAAFNVRHRVQAYGYALVEEERPGRFDEQAAPRLGVSPGSDFGRLQQGEPVKTATGDEVRPEQVLGESRRGRNTRVGERTRPGRT